MIDLLLRERFRVRTHPHPAQTPKSGAASAVRWIAARESGQLELVAFGWFGWHSERQIVDLRPSGI